MALCDNWRAIDPCMTIAMYHCPQVTVEIKYGIVKCRVVLELGANCEGTAEAIQLDRHKPDSRG